MLLLSPRYLPFVLLAALISPACAAPTPPPPLQRVTKRKFVYTDRPKLPPMYQVNVHDATGTFLTNVPSTMYTRIGELIMDLDPELDPNDPTHNGPEHSPDTHNGQDHSPTQNGRGDNSRGWESKVMFASSHSSKHSETQDNPKNIVYFDVRGLMGKGGPCSSWLVSQCNGYVVEIEGHSDGTTVAVGAVVVQTKPVVESAPDTYTVLDHIPPSEIGHAASINKHREKFEEFMKTSETMKKWQVSMTKENVKISDRLGWTPSPGTHPHPHAGHHSP